MESESERVLLASYSDTLWSLQPTSLFHDDRQFIVNVDDDERSPSSRLAALCRLRSSRPHTVREVACRAGQHLNFHFHAALFIYLLILTFLDETALVHHYSVLSACN